MKTRYVQIQNPRTKEWVRIDTREGCVVGHRAKPYAAPVVHPGRGRRSKLHTARARYRKVEAMN